MEISHNSAEPVRAYLLGTLPEEESVALEERYFRDRDFFLWVRAVETRLIEDYLNGQLPAVTMQPFESRYLRVPELRRRLEEIRGERTAAARQNQRVLIWGWRPIMAAALICVAGATFWAYVHFKSILFDPSGSGGHPLSVATMQVLLKPGLTKGDGGTKMTEFGLPATETRIQFFLEFPDQRDQLRAQILTPEANGKLRKVWSCPLLSESPPESGRPRFFVEVDSRVLQPLDYVLQVLGPDGAVLQSYVFRVTPRSAPHAGAFDPPASGALLPYSDCAVHVHKWGGAANCRKVRA